jgi:hypothetical protein
MKIPRYTFARVALFLVAAAGVGLAAASGPVGCATSKPFALAVVHASPGLLADVRHYAATDEQHAQADRLAQLTSQEQTVNVADVESAWEAVSPWYTAAFEADPALREDERRLRRDAAGRFKSLIEHEKARPLGLGTAAGGS